MRVWWMIPCWLALFATEGWAAKPKLAVMPLLASGVEDRIATALTDILAVELSSRFAVVSRDEIAAMLGLEVLKQAMGCDEVSCTTEIAGALGVDFLVTGNVTRLADKLQLKLTLFDSREMQVLARVLKRAVLDETQYESAIIAAVAELWPAPPQVLPIGTKVLGGLLLGAGGLGVVSGVAFAVAAGNTNAEIEAGGLYQDEVDELQTTLRGRQIGMGVSFGLAAVAAVTGLVVLLTGYEDAPAGSGIVLAPLVSNHATGLCVGIPF